MTARPSNTVELTISEVVYRGKGLARLDGLAVFVPDVLPGELVRVHITQLHKNFAEADLVEIIRPSPYRVTPACALADICPGCCYLHSDYGEEIQIKNRQLMNFLEHNCGIDNSVCKSPVPSPCELNYRNRITLHAQTNETKTVLGYIGRDNLTVIDVLSCPIAIQPINDMLSGLRADIKFTASLKSRLKVYLRHTEKSGACCWMNSRLYDLAGVTGMRHRQLSEKTAIGDFEVPPAGFFQVNIPVMDAMIKYIMEILYQTHAKTMIDLYCGCGVFAVAGAVTGINHVIGIDIDRQAIAAARRNAKARGMDNVEFVESPADWILKSALDAVIPEETVVLVDPTRKGLDKAVIEAITDCNPRNIVYVSCAADTMTRDIKKIIEADYGIQSSRIFDMFPRTAYFESVTHLQHH